MATVQERLQLKRVPLDTWNVREKLCLASAVVRSGDQNWMSVSRALKTVCDPSRPPEWYSQKSCAAQYGALLENVETPKRKKRNSEGAGETPQESILKKLTQERIAEIQANVAEINQQYNAIKNEMTEAQNPSTSIERLRELWNSLEARGRQRDAKAREKEKEVKPRVVEKPRVVATILTTASAPPAPSSPLLSSLLKSSPVVTTPQHMPHPATVVETMSPSAGAPTLAMLLDKAGPPPPPPAAPHDTRHAAIEHIKSQLVQIERQLKVAATAPPPPLDIDEIEIKAEDVYAFRDVDIDIQPVAAMHKPPPPAARPLEKTPSRKDSEETPIHEIAVQPLDTDDVTPIPEDVSTDANVSFESIQEEPTQPPEVPPRSVVLPPEVNLSFPDVKFPVPEIKVIGQEEHTMKEEVLEQETLVEQDSATPEVVDPETAPVEEPPTETVPEAPPAPAAHDPTGPPARDPTAAPAHDPTASDDSGANVDVETVEAAPITSEETTTQVESENTQKPNEATIEQEKILDTAVTEKTDEIPVAEIKPEKDETEQENLTPDAKTESEPEPLEPSSDSKPEEKESEEVHTETDDDTPMELVREEEKDGKKRKDYSRKKKPDSRTCSGSESAAETSAPESPGGGSDADRQHRLWKKSVMLVYSRLAGHKYASLFLRPITDAEAPGYSAAVRRPMDLGTIKRNVESGVTRTTEEFQRDILLMLTNALMYNSSGHHVYHMTKDMFAEAEGQLSILLAAQSHAGLAPAPRRAPRRRADSAAPSPVPSKRRHIEGVN